MAAPLGSAPQLFAAAREAGASRGQALDVLRVSAVAVVVSATRSPRRPGLRNAQRHFAWQACLAARFGERVATAVGEAQERGRRRSEDSEVDRHNNRVGRVYGAVHADALSAMTVPAAVRDLCHAAMPRWRSGELRVVSRRQ